MSEDKVPATRSPLTYDDAVKLLRQGHNGFAEWNRLRQEWREHGIDPPDMSWADLSGISSLPQLETIEVRGTKQTGHFVDPPGDKTAAAIGQKVFIPSSSSDDRSMLDLADVLPELKAKIRSVASQFRGTGADFSGMNFQHAKFDGAKLPNANFRGAILASASFTKAEVPISDFSDAILTLGQFQKCNATLSDFSRAHADHANWTEAILRSSTFDDANLKNAKFIQTLAIDASFPNATLSGADLSGTNLSGVGEPGFLLGLIRLFFPWYPSPFFLDSNRIADTQFPAHAQDAWSVLRAAYTGSKLVFVVLFTILALLPTILQVFALALTSRVQEEAIPVVVSLLHKGVDVLKLTGEPLDSSRERILAIQQSIKSAEQKLQVSKTLDERIAAAAELFALVPAIREQLKSTGRALQSSRQKLQANLEELTKQTGSAEQAITEVQKKLERIEQKLASVSMAESWMNQGQQLVLLSDSGKTTRTTRIWQVIVRANEGLPAAALAGLLLLYNIGRGVATYYLSGIRETEERNRMSPAKSQYYVWWHLHRVLFAPILIVSVALSASQLFALLNRPLLILENATPSTDT